MGRTAAQQDALREADVLVVGAGPLGASAAQYLAADGVGRIGLVDGATDAGRGRAETVAARLHAVNPSVLAEPYPTELDDDNAIALAAGRTCVLDCAGVPAMSRAVNDACLTHGTPFVTARVDGLEGRLTSVIAGSSACYRCLFGEDEPAPAGPGILSALDGMLGAAQALEAVRLIAGIGDPLAGRVMRFDGLGMTVEAATGQPRPDCSCRGVLEGLGAGPGGAG